MTIRLAALSGLPVAALAACPALAAEEAELQSIIVNGVRDAAAEVARTPGGADFVPAEAFGDKVAVSLRDALAFSPGVYTQPRFGQEVRISIRGSGLSRGFHMRGLTLLQDGVPINLADNNGDFQELDPLVFDSIEVYRGANALRYGSATLGGGINARTPTGRTRPGIRARVDGGSFDTVRAMASAGFANEEGDAWLAAVADRSDGERQHSERGSLRFNGNVGLKIGPGIETRFYASAQHIRQELPGALPMSLVRTAPETSLPANISGDQARDIDSLRLQNRTSIALGANTALEVGTFVNAKDLFHPIFQVIDQKSTDIGAYSRLTHETRRIGLTLGATARWGDLTAKQFANLGGRRNGAAPTALADQHARTIDLYGEVRVAPASGLSLSAGGVYVAGRRSVDNRIRPSASDSRTYREFSPKFGLLYEIAPAAQIYANVSRSAELPGLSELAQAQPDPGFVPLKAQTAWTAEIGTRGEAGVARWDLTFYRADIRSELLQYSVLPGTVPAATFNAGETRHQGVEAGLDLALAPWASLRQTYQLSDFRFRGDSQFGDNRLPVVASHLYRAALRLGTRRLNVAPNVEWLPRGAWADYANSVRADGYALFGLTAEADIAERFTLFVDARNLTDEKKAGDISAVVRVTGPLQAIYYPVERRAVFGGVRARF